MTPSKAGLLVLAALTGPPALAGPPEGEPEPAGTAAEIEAPPTLARRTELGVSGAALVGRPLSTRGAVGARLGYHVSDLFSVEAWGLLSPGHRSGWRPLTTQLLPDEPLGPDLVTLRAAAAGTAHFTPVRGSLVAGRHTLAIGAYGLVGFGAVHTLEPAWAVGCQQGDPCNDTLAQVHPTTNLGGGLRVASSRMLGRVELRRIAWIENLGGVSLESKRDLVVELSVGGHWGSAD